MEINFEKYTRVNSIYEGQAIERIDIPSDIVIDEILKKYKDVQGIDTNCQIVKMSEYKEKIQELQRDYYSRDVKNIPNIDVEYAYIEEWEDSTPHGSFTRIEYGGEATEQDYNVKKALTKLKDILNNV